MLFETQSRFDAVTTAAPLRAVVVGTGSIGRMWLRAVGRHPGLTLVGAADLDERQARGALIRIGRGDLPVARDFGGLVKLAPDVCVNATPPQAHAEVSRAALAAGCAVLSEKPFAASLAQAVELTELAGAARRLLMVSQSRSYEPGLLRLRSMVAGLGRLGVINTDFSLAHKVSGFRAAMDHPLLLDMAVHAFDAARLLSGARPVWVYCDAYNPSWSWFDGAAAAVTVTELSEGARHVYNGNWCTDGLPTSWSGRWRVTGEHGVAEWDGEGMPISSYGEPEAVLAADDDPVGQLMRPLDEFVNALRSGHTPWGECSDNLYTLAMVEAAVVSASRGEKVHVQELIEGARGHLCG